jgi:hemoglobin-like flavoprotein
MLFRDSVNRVIDQEQGERFADRFYVKLFELFPEMEQFFRDLDMKRQAAMLTMSLQVVAQHYRRPQRNTRDYLIVLGERHHQRGISRGEYRKFQHALLETLAEFHGEQWTSELADTWNTAFSRAIDVMLEGDFDDPMSP